MSMKTSQIERVVQDGPLSRTVISAVAEATDTDPTEIEPLYETLDPDALDRLFQRNPMAPYSFDGRVSFTMEGCDVVVHADQRVTVTPPEGDRTDDRTEFAERDTR